MKSSKWKLDQLPPVSSPWRKAMMTFTKGEDYRKEIEAGLPFFTEEELSSIEERFRETGMTRKDIMAEVYRKGWLIKESTLKNYIQKDQVPRAIKKTKTDKGMISIYPNNMIRHLNFVRYCVFVDGASIRAIVDLVRTFLSHDDEAYLKSVSLKVEGYECYPSNFQGDDCLHALWTGINVDKFAEGVEWTKLAVEKAFEKYPAKKTTYLKTLHEMEKIQGRLETMMVEFEKGLKSNKTPIHPDELETLIQEDGKGGE
jgi:hypothetical protein